ncbi:hypothetical protein VP01_1876g4 [Puccinia sorghi]|uniref:Uncharacterized protein n=1 Tax=Puccinia sorghi TaxID=27349 RepID=A0A0L6VD47_9BASI|nr:hypothetical protein VP01_1876g4 [Puccinia sorghi]
MNPHFSNKNLVDALEKLVYDTHLEYSILSNFNLINNPKLSKVELSCSYGSVRATHTGSLTLNGCIIQPVFYAPEFSKNSISAAQLEDHGFRIVHAGGSIQICKGEKIFWCFRRNNGSFTLPSEFQELRQCLPSKCRRYQLANTTGSSIRPLPKAVSSTK